MMGGEMHLDHNLCPGTVQRSNALARMRNVGLPIDLPELGQRRPGASAQESGRHAGAASPHCT